MGIQPTDTTKNGWPIGYIGLDGISIHKTGEITARLMFYPSLQARIDKQGGQMDRVTFRDYDNSNPFTFVYTKLKEVYPGNDVDPDEWKTQEPTQEPGGEP